MSSTNRIRANRKNAQKSTGPRTSAGKAAVAQNARQHGLSGGFTILAHEDRVEFQDLLEQYRQEFAPASMHERFVVEEMAQARWTLARARRIEAHLLDQTAGAEPLPHDPDAAIAAALNKKSPNALATLQRYGAAAERSYFRAHRALTQGRSSQIRNKAKEAEVWLQSRLLGLEPGPSTPHNFDPDHPDSGIFNPPSRTIWSGLGKPDPLE